jgi:hypothetical protein
MLARCGRQRFRVTIGRMVAGAIDFLDRSSGDIHLARLPRLDLVGAHRPASLLGPREDHGRRSTRDAARGAAIEAMKRQYGQTLAKSRKTVVAVGRREFPLRRRSLVRTTRAADRLAKAQRPIPRAAAGAAPGNVTRRHLVRELIVTGALLDQVGRGAGRGRRSRRRRRRSTPGRRATADGGGAAAAPRRPGGRDVGGGRCRAQLMIPPAPGNPPPSPALLAGGPGVDPGASTTSTTSTAAPGVPGPQNRRRPSLAAWRRCPVAGGLAELLPAELLPALFTWRTAAAAGGTWCALDAGGRLAELPPAVVELLHLAELPPVTVELRELLQLDELPPPAGGLVDVPHQLPLPFPWRPALSRVCDPADVHQGRAHKRAGRRRRR